MRPRPPPEIPKYYKRIPTMLHFLLAKIPAELVCEIALFDGRIIRAHLRDYISEVYAHEYQSYFGYRYTLRFLCGGAHTTSR